MLRGLALESVARAFTTYHAGYWHPLTWLSHMLDVELFGPDPGWAHRVSVLFHLLNAELLFFLLWRLTGRTWPSAAAAALFAVHPLHVESVAWVAERKDVLSTLFGLLSVRAYLRYVQRPVTRRYLATAALFALGLLCKPMLVTLPLVLLVLDWWPLGRTRSVPPGRLLREKAPLLALSLASAVITLINASGVGTVSSFELVPFWSRLSNAAVSYVVYLVKTAWPSGLAAFYPHPATLGKSIPAWKVAGVLALLCALSALCFREARRRPYLGAGWLWYLVTLFPVIGLAQAGGQAWADRYSYVPLIGVFIALSWGLPDLVPAGPRGRAALGVAAVACVAVLSAAAWVQASYWRDSVTLFSRAVAVTRENWLAWNCLGQSQWKLGRRDLAVGYYREALRINPLYSEAWNNLGGAYAALGRDREAAESYAEALRINPDYSEAWNDLGALVQQRLGRDEQALGYYREALRINPEFAEAWNNMGAAHGHLGRYREAAECFERALRIRPDYPEARNNLAAARSVLSGPNGGTGGLRPTAP